MRRRPWFAIAGLASVALWLGTGISLIAGVESARADAANYAGTRRQIRACVLVSSASMQNGLPRNFAPHLFYILERRQDVKPGGWEFINPLAPTTLTGEVRARWVARGGAADTTLGSPAFQPGGPVTKNLGAYWEVNLDRVSANDLQQFDIVYMGYRGNVVFTPEQRDKLRRYMDGGGTVWLEDLGGMTIGGNTLNGQFALELTIGTPGSTVVQIAANAGRHPIVYYPYALSPMEAGLVGAFSNVRRSHAPLVDSPAARALVPVLTIGGQRYLSAMDYGAGHLVVSTAGIATGVAGYAGGANVEGPNTGAVSGEAILNAQPNDLKIAYNIVAWTSSVPTGAVNSRRTGASSDNIGSALGRKWSAVPLGAGNPGSGAVIYKNAVFLVDGQNVLRCYDATPGDDADGDRNEDDGVPDYRQGAPYDEIWRVQLPQNVRFSTPTVMSAVLDSGLTADIVAVTSSVGVTLAYNAFPRDASGRLAPTSPLLYTVGLGTGADLSAVLQNQPVPAPVYSEGVLFSLVYAENATPNAPWRIAAVNAITGQNVFGTGGLAVAPTHQTLTTAVPGMGAVVGPLSVAYVRDEATGAVDKVIYAPTRPINSPGSGAVHGVWFSTRNETLVRENPNVNTPRYRPIGNRARIPWFAPPSGGPEALLPVLHVVRRDPNNLVIGVESYRFPNGFTVTYEGAVNNRNTIVTLTGITLNQNDSLVADYTVNWPAAPYAAPSNPSTPQGPEMFQFSNTRIFNLITPPPANPADPAAAFVTGHVGISGQDALVFAARWTGSLSLSDRVYGVREQFNIGTNIRNQASGNGTDIRWMFSPHTGGAFLDNQTSTTVQLVPRLINRDTYGGAIVAGQHFATNLRIVGSPAVYQDVAYVVATATMQGAGSAFPATVIMALRANPRLVFSADVQFLQDNTQVRLEQIDLTRSGVNNAGAVFVEVPSGNYQVDRISGTIAITNARLANGDAIDFSLPLWISVGTQQRQLLVDRQTGYGPLDNLLWYMIIPRDLTIPNLPDSLRRVIVPSLTPASGPTVLGNTLYFGTMEGRVAAVELRGGSGGTQVPVLTGRTSGAGRPVVHVQDVQTNLVDGTLLVQPIIHPPVGAAGLLAVGAPRGGGVLEWQKTLIADNNRLLEVDSEGNAVWSLDATRTVTVAGGSILDSGQVAATVTSLARPGVARHFTLSTYLVADTGNNRVLQVDRGGFVTFELRSVRNDMFYLRPNDPLTLNLPTDVQTYTRSGTGLSFFNRETGVTYTYSGNFLSTHYLIADSGNYRLLEVVFAYDPNGQPITMTPDAASAMRGFGPVVMNGQVVFVTRTLSEQSARFRYRTIQQFALPGARGDLDVFLLAAVDNQRQSALDPGAVALGAFGTNEQASGGSLVILRRDFRAASSNRDGDVARVIHSIAFPENPFSDTIVRRQTVSNPVWFKEFEISRGGQRQPRYLMCDDTGCYMLRPGANDLIVEWALTAEDYYWLTGRRLQAVSIQRLAQADYDPVNNLFHPRFLITNRFTGDDEVPTVFGVVSTTRRGRVTGEVFEIRGIDYYRGGYRAGNNRLYLRAVDGVLEPNPGSAITWLFPKETLPGRNPVTGAPVVGPIRRSVGTPDGATTTYLLEQPSYAERPY
ncbi:MAG: DUF4159 domain-containing protein [Chthonomonadaceae bacterium]|nr:DUF4159 domain-containing protein [Chthonomonadaceae bacterium]